MKNTLIFTILLTAQLLFAAVDTRLVYVSNTHNFPSPGLSTLVLDVEAISNTSNIQISAFQDAIQLDTIFRAQTPSVSFTNQLFPSSGYTTNEDYRASDGRIRYIYTYNSGTYSTISNTFTRILTISIQYTTGFSNGSISWFSGTPNYYVADNTNTVITGAELEIPSELSVVPLPVELSSFTANADQNTVDLKWETKTEFNNSGFNVERRINEGEWKTLGFIEGHGTTTESKEYSFIDDISTIQSTLLIYRLKQIDFNGSFEYSDVVEVEIVPTQFELSQNYPNPFNPSTTIKFSLPEETQLKINIYNMLGELVETIAEGIYETGYHKVKFDASALPSGAYIYRIESSDPSTSSGQSFVQNKKMMLLK